MNFLDIVILLGFAAALIGVLRYIRRQKKKGCCIGCGGGCASCPHACAGCGAPPKE